MFPIDNVEEGQGVRKVRKRDRRGEGGGVQDPRIKPAHLLDCARAAAREWAHRPATICVLPSLGGAWRPSSAARACRKLAKLLREGPVKVEEAVFGECDEGTEGGVLKASTPHPSSLSSAAFASFQAQVGVQQHMAARMDQAEEIMSKTQGGSFFSEMPGMALRCEGLSKATLRLVYTAAKEFHDAKVWDTLSNYEPLEVRE